MPEKSQAVEQVEPNTKDSRAVLS